MLSLKKAFSLLFNMVNPLQKNVLDILTHRHKQLTENIMSVELENFDSDSIGEIY